MHWLAAVPYWAFLILDSVRRRLVHGSLARVRVATWEVCLFPAVLAYFTWRAVSSSAAISNSGAATVILAINAALVAYCGWLTWQAWHDSHFPNWMNRIRAGLRRLVNAPGSSTATEGA